MKRFIRKTISLSIPIIIGPLAIVMYYGFPPPKLSTSISFNAKILNIKKMQMDRTIGVLAIGSSMSLNNIHTATIKKHFGKKKYVNLSSWGQNIIEDYKLIKFFAERHKPETIIISSGYMDFNNYSKEINYGLLKNYIDENETTLKEMSLRYLLTKSIMYSKFKNDTTNYTSLFYDDCGGVNLKKNNFNISQVRWNGNSIEKFALSSLNYTYLDSIAQYCKSHNIELVFVQSPYRKGYYSQLNKQSLNILHIHENKINSILSNHDQMFIRTESVLWVDDLFVDYSHLSEKGAKKYTQYFINEYEARTHNNGYK